MRMGIMGYNQGKSPSTAPYRVVRLRDPTKHDCTHMILYMYKHKVFCKKCINVGNKLNFFLFICKDNNFNQEIRKIKERVSRDK